MPRKTVAIGTRPMSLDELLAIAVGAAITVDSEAESVILDSRSIVDGALASGRGVYGLNLGLGHMKDTRLPEAQLQALQEPMVEGHAGAIGPPLPAPVVRAAMAARINGMARGGSGASLACSKTYAAMLNAGVHPIVPGSGSVGASDLAQMAAIARVAIGRGFAEFRGETMAGAEAMRRAGIALLILQPKDGLTLMSHNGISIGHGALVLARAMQMLEVADLTAALSLEAMSGNTSPFEAVVAAAKGVHGQAAVSDHIRGLLAGSEILDEDLTRSIQDALSFRVVPQVHGALWESIAQARTSLETELNAMTDNPLVSRSERRLISNGNFHPIMVALSFDGLRPALAHVGQLSDRRMNHLWRASFERPSTANRSVWGSSAEMRGTSLRYAGAAASAELRQLAATATLDVGPLDLGVEDHATGAPISVRKTETGLDRLQEVLAVELLLARDLLMARGAERRIGVGGRASLAAINDSLHDFSASTDSRDFHSAVMKAMGDQMLPGARAVAVPLSWTG